MKKYDKVIVLGAGFSKALCGSMPLIKNLLDNVSEESSVEKFMRKVKYELNDYFDIENTISYILSREIFFNQKEDIEFYVLRKELLKFIHNQIKCYHPDEDKMELMEKFLYYCVEENAAIITFNYDLFIEKICGILNEKNKINDHKYRLFVDYGMSINKNPYVNDESADVGELKDKCVELLKLHGSFNWFNMSDFEDADISDIISLDEEEITDFYSDETPYYVPMSNTKYKYFKGNFYKMLWKKMNYYINTAKELTFIGYGFPKTDFDNLMLFSEYKDKVKNIVISNSEEDKAKKIKLEKIFADANIHTVGAIKFIEGLVKDVKVIQEEV